MSNTLTVRLSTKKRTVTEGTEPENYFEGTVTIAGLKPTKLARKSDGSTQFPTKAAVSGAARNLAKSLGFADVEVADATASKVAAKATPRLAKKSS